MKPTRYFVEYEIEMPHGFDVSFRDFIRLTEAKKFRDKKDKGGWFTRILERFDFKDVTPSGESFSGLCWEYEIREIKD